MTLIARFRCNNVPLYFGDLLLSRHGRTDELVNLPSSIDINSRLNSDATRSIVGLRQKVNVIDDNLIVAWAGDQLQARMLLREIRDAVRNGADSYAEINQLIAGIGAEDRNDVSLIGTILSRTDGGQTKLSHFGYCIWKENFSDFEVSAAGTGTDELMETAAHFAKEFPCLRAEEESFNWAIQVGMSLTAFYVGSEIVGGYPLRNWWGGGIEYASVIEGRFQKVGNILHTYWKAKKCNGQYELEFLPRLLKYDYVDDLLIMQTVDLAEELGAARNTLKARCDLAFPLLRAPREYSFEFLFPNLSHATLCCFIILEPEIPGLYPTVVRHEPAGQSPFVIAQDSNRYQFGFDERLLMNLREAVGKATGMPASIKLSSVSK